MWVRGFVIGVIISCILHLVSTKPFLHNALINLASSASASSSSISTDSSSPSARLTNIVNYTKRREKVQRLENQKQLFEDVDDKDESNNKDNNEASPSLIQKKINKIFAKIQLLTSFSGPSQTTTEQTENENNSTETTTEKSKSEVKIEFEEIVPKNKPQKLISPRKVYGEPLKIQLEINEVGNSTDVADDVEVISEDQMMNRVGNVAVFFLELFGSLVGLAYGAAAHINNALQGARTPETAI